MAFVSRLVNLFERMMTSSKEFEVEEEPGLWMAAGEAPPSVASGATDTFAAPPPPILPDVRPDAPQAPQSAGPFIDAGTPPPELEERMPSIRIAAAAAEAIPESTVGPAPDPVKEDAPAAEPPAIPEGAVHTMPAGEGSGSGDDMLSMFRSVAVTSASSSLAKDIEDVTAQELLAEAIALRDLLVGAPAPTE
jgi:hypothetical protein